MYDVRIGFRICFAAFTVQKKKSEKCKRSRYFYWYPSGYFLKLELLMA